MSIKEIIEKSKRFPNENKDIFVIIVLVVVAFGSFGLGRLSKTEELASVVRIENMNASVVDAVNNETKSVLSSINTNKKETSSTSQAGGFYIASKNGSKYHLPWCSGAKRIKETNKVIFKTEKEAQKAGYSPAGNCKGLR